VDARERDLPVPPEPVIEQGSSLAPQQLLGLLEPLIANAEISGQELTLQPVTTSVHAKTDGLARNKSERQGMGADAIRFTQAATNLVVLIDRPGRLPWPIENSLRVPKQNYGHDNQDTRDDKKSETSSEIPLRP
jgi:hypothetical protein